MLALADVPSRARLIVKRTPWLYRPAKRLTGRGAIDHLCRRSHDICIEGYPSSGNSFSYAMLKLANGQLRIAHHCHSVANLRIALDYDIPAIALIRNPADAIASRLARFHGAARTAILEYVDFYDFVEAQLDRIIVTTFDEVTHRPSVFLDRVAAATRLPLAVNDVGPITREAKAYLRDWTQRNADIEKISLPSSAREEQKAALIDTIRRTPAFHDAQRLWTVISDHAARPISPCR